MPVKTIVWIRLRLSSSGSCVPAKAVCSASSLTSLSPGWTSARSSPTSSPSFFFISGVKFSPFTQFAYWTRLRIAFPEDLVADPVERFEIRRFARRGHDFDGGREASALAVLFTRLYAAEIVERLVLANRHVSGRPGKDFGKVEFLPLRCKFGNRIDPAHTGGSAG